jgi:hypothetical protein
LCAFFGAKTHVVWGREIREVREIREFREGVLGGQSCFSAPEAQLFVAIAFTFREKFIYLHHCPYIQRYKILKI